MANTKITALPLQTAMAILDLIHVVDDPSGSATNKRISFQGLLNGVEQLNQLSAVPASGDTFLVIDNGLAKYVSMEDMLTRHFQMEPFSMVSETACATGNGKAYMYITDKLDGLSLVSVQAGVHTAGVETAATMDIQIRNHTDTVDMLSTLLTIDTAETSSATAAAAAVIKSDGSEVVAEGDVLAVDFDRVHATTAANGCLVTLGFA